MYMDLKKTNGKIRTGSPKNVPKYSFPYHDEDLESEVHGLSWV